MGCDANSKDTIWGSTKCNPRGDKLLDFILESDLNIQNVGTSPTFVTSIRQQVLDLTLSNNLVSDQIWGWRVMEEVPLSDHRYVRFYLKVELSVVPPGRNPRKADWNAYETQLQDKVSHVGKLRNVESIEAMTKKLESAIIETY